MFFLLESFDKFGHLCRRRECLHSLDDPRVDLGAERRLDDLSQKRDDLPPKPLVAILEIKDLVDE